PERGRDEFARRGTAGAGQDLPDQLYRAVGDGPEFAAHRIPARPKVDVALMFEELGGVRTGRSRFDLEPGRRGAAGDPRFVPVGLVLRIEDHAVPGNRREVVGVGRFASRPDVFHHGRAGAVGLPGLVAVDPVAG